MLDQTQNYNCIGHYNCIEQISINSIQTELFHLRLLLLCKKATSFDDLRTVNEI